MAANITSLNGKIVPAGSISKTNTNSINNILMMDDMLISLILSIIKALCPFYLFYEILYKNHPN